MELLDCALCAILVYECDYGYFPIFDEGGVHLILQPASQPRKCFSLQSGS